MHGGFSDARDFDGNLAELADSFRVLMPERRGHGHTPDVPGPYRLDAIAQDMIGFLEKVAGGPARVVGYSAGALVALRVALLRPDLVRRLVLISGGYDMSGLLVVPSAEGELPPPVVQAYGEVSPDGVEHLPVVRDKVVKAAGEPSPITAGDLAGVACRTLVMVADDDIVTLEHTLALYRGIPDAELAVVPRASHLLLHEKPEVCTTAVRDFLASDATPTWMPIRRAG